MRRVVRSVSSNVALPALPEARMEIRSGMPLPPLRMMAKAGGDVKGKRRVSRSRKFKLTHYRAAS